MKRGNPSRALVGLALTLVILVNPLSADPPASFDLRDVGGQQYVSTRIDDQVGPGPCWSFAIITAVESNIRMRGMWEGEPNDLNLSEQFLRCNETSGEGYSHTSPGYTRVPNRAGREMMGISHMARLHGPLYESQVPFEYYEDDADYYDAIYSSIYPDKTQPGWDYATPFPAVYESNCQGKYFLKRSVRVSGHDAIKQKVMTVGAPYVSIYHKFEAYDPATNTYYDDGTASGDGLGGHAVNIIGWDDSKVVPGAPNAGAWLIKHSHEVDAQDPDYDDHAGEAPTYFWVSYDTPTNRFMDYYGEVAFFDMGTKEHIRSVHFTDYGGDNGSSLYPREADEDDADYSQCATVYEAGPQREFIKTLSFFTREADQPYQLRLYGSMADLETGAPALREVAGSADLPGYHTVELPQALLVDANDDFVVHLDFTDGSDVAASVSSDNGKVIEILSEGSCFYFVGGEQNTWKDMLYEYIEYGGEPAEANWQAWTVKAYGVDIFAGDASLDGTVSLADLSALAANWGSADADWEMGDFNGDGEVSLADLSALAGNWGKSLPGSSPAGGIGAIPEPASLAVIALGTAALLRRRRR
ncbi:MAG: lectin like domain-containing protein [Phycisphaerae bacterium]